MWGLYGACTKTPECEIFFKKNMPIKLLEMYLCLIAPCILLIKVKIALETSICHWEHL